MFLHVIDAEYLNNYAIAVEFNDGKKGIVDFKSHSWEGVFSLLKQPEYFAKFFVDKELGTIAWPNGVDIAPEYLYFQAFKNDPILQAQFKKWEYIADEKKAS